MNHRVSNAIALFLVALIVLAVVSAAFAAPMPWKLFNEPAMLKANVYASPGLCRSTTDVAQAQEIFLAGFLNEDGIYVMAYAPLSGRILFSFTPPNSEVPTEIGFGRVDLETPGAHNVIPPLRWEPFQMNVHNDICRVLFAASA